jgi:hypothetical protein
VGRTGFGHGPNSKNGLKVEGQRRGLARSIRQKSGTQTIRRADRKEKKGEKGRAGCTFYCTRMVGLVHAKDCNKSRPVSR